MGKSYLTPRGPQGFEKISSSSSSDKAYIRLKSKVHTKPFVHTPFHTSTKHILNKLAIRTKSSKMSNTSSPKRVRRGSDAEERPTKHSRRLSDSDVSASSSRESTEATTGLESSGILDNISPKCSPTTFTQVDRKKYLRRAKINSFAWRRQRKRDLARQVQQNWNEMPNAAQQGMKNLTGTLCYRHSLFQALLHCPKIAHWLRSFHPPQTCFVDKATHCIACQLRSVIKAYWSGKFSDLTQELRTIDKVFRANGWTPGALSGQADPEEQFTWMIGKLNEQLPGPIYAFFDALHNFVLNSSTTCTKCGHVSTNQGETEGILSIELRPRLPNGELSDYLDKYMSYSVTDYKCEKCKDTAEKQRTRLISHSPDVVVVQLKRFDPLGRKDKHPIPFSSTLDLTSYRTASNKTSSKYELSAVVSHLGGTSGGHYRCIAKGEDSCWNIFDDLRKIAAKESQALDAGNGKSWTPYLLFFQRKRKIKSTQT
ncbi:cysteine proteinase [Hyaloscypha hepaticicola]|uniref:ubiquitinyl hydrolase 1 n=1 Tax=Hyaloscypha hepaticicola TaxID=2082293 RepID=A0A2J6QJV7_9HELO|nr:cysteine proteinase [Hyaloscypha hepaticicola]